MIYTKEVRRFFSMVSRKKPVPHTTFIDHSVPSTLLRDEIVDGVRTLTVNPGNSGWPTSGEFWVEVEGQIYLVERK